MPKAPLWTLDKPLRPDAGAAGRMLVSITILLVGFDTVTSAA